MKEPRGVGCGSVGRVLAEPTLSPGFHPQDHIGVALHIGKCPQLVGESGVQGQETNLDEARDLVVLVCLFLKEVGLERLLSG